MGEFFGRKKVGRLRQKYRDEGHFVLAKVVGNDDVGAVGGDIFTAAYFYPRQQPKEEAKETHGDEVSDWAKHRLWEM